MANWIAYMSDYDGDEQWDIFFVSPKTGQVVNITKTREISEESPVWSADGRYLAYTVKPKTSSVYEIDVYDTLMREVKHLTTGTAKDLMNVDPIWSKDGKFIVYSQHQAKGTNSNLFLVDLATAQSTLLTPHEGGNSIPPTTFRRTANRSCSVRLPPTVIRMPGCSTLPPRRFAGSPGISGRSPGAAFPRMAAC